MIDQRDIHSAAKKFDIVYTPSAKSYGTDPKKLPSVPAAATIGTLYCHYSVRAVDNVANFESRRSYIVSCRQRLIINNPTTPSINLPLSLQAGGPGMIVKPGSAYRYANLSGVAKGDESSTTGYYFYPVWAMSSVSLAVSQGAIHKAWLLDYQPRTLNSTVSLSSSSGVGSSGGNAQTYSNVLQKSSGSANTTTQNYEVSLSVGAMDGVTASAGWGDSRTQDSSRSRALGSDRSSQMGSSLQNAYNDAMTVKDWGVYSCVDVAPSGASAPAIASCTWFLSQEYPYNFLSTNTEANTSSDSPAFPYELNLSAAEAANVFPLNFSASTSSAKSYQISPPTALAMLGGDFVQTSSWQIDTTHSESEAPFLTPSHVVDAIFASHFTAATSTPGTVNVVGQLNPSQTKIHTGPTLDLSLLALDPIASNTGANGAVVGFLPGRFLVPVATGALSRSVSAANNLMVLTQGFTAAASTRPASNSVLSASLAATSFSAQINVCFKLLPFAGDLNLYLKHWVATAASGCTLSLWFNPPGYTPTGTGQPQDPATSTAIPADMTVALNMAEGAGGDNNLLAINLRNASYDTVDYHDYLVPGMNVIVIGLQAASASADYSIRAVAVGA